MQFCTQENDKFLSFGDLNFEEVMYNTVTIVSNTVLHTEKL